MKRSCLSFVSSPCHDSFNLSSEKLLATRRVQITLIHNSMPNRMSATLVEVTCHSLLFGVPVSLNLASNAPPQLRCTLENYFERPEANSFCMDTIMRAGAVNVESQIINTALFHLVTVSVRTTNTKTIITISSYFYKKLQYTRRFSFSVAVKVPRWRFHWESWFGEPTQGLSGSFYMCMGSCGK